MLQCVAVGCSVLQCVAVGCSGLQCVAHVISLRIFSVRSYLCLFVSVCVCEREVSERHVYSICVDYMSYVLVYVYSQKGICALLDSTVYVYVCLCIYV